jgi:hypothetical protein
VQRLVFSAARYPNIKSHTEAAIVTGWPRILVLNRPDADKRRDRLLIESGLRRDRMRTATSTRWPLGAAARNGTLKGLVRGINPIGWMADVKYVPDRENQSHGSSLGAQLRRFCNDTRFRYVFG